MAITSATNSSARLKRLGDDRQREIKDFAYELLLELYDNEAKYTEALYDRRRPDRGR